MSNVTLSPCPGSVRTYSGALPLWQPGPAPCFCHQGSHPDLTSTPEPSLAPWQQPFCMPSPKHNLIPDKDWATSGQWASLYSTETCCKVPGAVCPSCPFPSFPEHVSLMSSSTFCLLLLVRSPLCCFPSLPALPQLGPSSTHNPRILRVGRDL